MPENDEFPVEDCTENALDSDSLLGILEDFEGDLPCLDEHETCASLLMSESPPPAELNSIPNLPPLKALGQYPSHASQPNINDAGTVLSEVSFLTSDCPSVVSFNTQDIAASNGKGRMESTPVPNTTHCKRPDSKAETKQKARMISKCSLSNQWSMEEKHSIIDIIIAEGVLDKKYKEEILGYLDRPIIRHMLMNLMRRINRKHQPQMRGVVYKCGRCQVPKKGHVCPYDKNMKEHIKEKDWEK